MSSDSLASSVAARGQNTSDRRNVSLDLLKVAMAFAVVALHAGFLEEHSDFGNYITTQGLFRIAVPVFLLVNGFFFSAVLENDGSRIGLSELWGSTWFGCCSTRTPGFLSPTSLEPRA